MGLKVSLDEKSDIRNITCRLKGYSSFFYDLQGKNISYLKSEEFWEKLSQLDSIKLSNYFYRYISDYFFSQQEVDNIYNEKVLCRCVSYLESSFHYFLKENPSISESDISGLIQVGAGCGSCLGDVHKIYNSIRAQSLTPFELVVSLNEFIKRNELDGFKILSTKKNNIYLTSNGHHESIKLINSFFLEHPRFQYFIDPVE